MTHTALRMLLLCLALVAGLDNNWSTKMATINTTSSIMTTTTALSKAKTCGQLVPKNCHYSKHEYEYKTYTLSKQHFQIIT